MNEYNTSQDHDDPSGEDFLARFYAALKTCPVYSSVRGVIYRYYNDGSKRSASVKTFNGDQVTVTFPESLREQIRENIDGKVDIRGILIRDENTDKPVKIHAEKITPITTTRVINITEMAGILGPDWYGMDSVAWQRHLRDD